MAEKELDCRGLACPNPVIKTKEVIDQGGVEKFTVLVDNLAAKENVSRFLQRSGYEVRVEEQAGTFAVIGRQGELAAPAARVAVKLGYQQVYRDPYGFPEWHKGGLPVTAFED